MVCLQPATSANDFFIFGFEVNKRALFYFGFLFWFGFDFDWFFFFWKILLWYHLSMYAPLCSRLFVFSY